MLIISKGISTHAWMKGEILTKVVIIQELKKGQEENKTIQFAHSYIYSKTLACLLFSDALLGTEGVEKTTKFWTSDSLSII